MWEKLPTGLVNLVAEGPAVDGGRDARVDGHREGRHGRQQPRGADDGRRLGGREPGPQREDDGPVAVDADR